jgi:hypothetical protein
MVPGGYNNTAGGNHSLAAGYMAKVRDVATANNNTTGDYGTFVWADDSTGTYFTSTGPNQFLIRAAGGVGIQTNAPHEALSIGTIAGLGSAIELGANVTKEINAGKIGYQKFSDALDILGAGTTGLNRKIKFWNEGGADFTGPIMKGPYTFIHSSGTNNTFIGENAGNLGITSIGNTAVGYQSLHSIVAGDQNTAMGQQALQNNTGSWNTAVGVHAMILNNTGSSNTAVGQNALYNSTGNSNIALGFGAGGNLSSGSNNIYIGSDVGSTIESNQIRIGTSAHTATYLSGNVYTTGGTIYPPSDVNLKTDFEQVDAATILDHVGALPVQTWRYKTDPVNLRHIGPTAQDFAAAFAVGVDDKHIATVDADGVALAAIKALKAENDALKARLERIEKLLSNIKP